VSFREVLTRRGDRLHLEDVPVARLAEEFDTPLYAYSRSALVERAERFERAFGDTPHLVAYSIKANLSLALAHTFTRCGLGIDVTSRGELERALRAGAKPEKIFFAGVGKQADEIDRALAVGIRMLNLESLEELECVAARARERGTVAPIAFRLNPDVDPKTHPHIATGLRTSKFGIPIEEAREAYARAKALPGVRVIGIDCHIGSQITSLAPFEEALSRIRAIALDLRADGHAIEVIDVGGGLGVDYTGQDHPPTPEAYVEVVQKNVGDLEATVVAEPGRALTANAGVLISRVLYRKENGDRRFVIVDGGMNDYLRPMLYSAQNRVETDPLRPGPKAPVDVVGPICETTDRFAKDRRLPPVEPGDLVVLRDVGAYGFCMSSTYNGRPLVAEVLVSGERADLIRERQTVEQTWAGERIPEESP
jgi:diaminopimelate decarboxylase